MACTAESLETNIKAAKYAALSRHDLLMCLTNIRASQLGLTATTAIAAAKAAGMAKLSDADLKKALEVLFCVS